MCAQVHAAGLADDPYAVYICGTNYVDGFDTSHYTKHHEKGENEVGWGGRCDG